MLAPLLMYGIPAALGGAAAYKQSGGNLGSTLLGAGLGAAIPGGLRLAGTALGETALGASLLGKGTSLLGKGASALQGAGIKAGMGPLAPIAAPTLTAAGLGTGAAMLGGAVAPGIAGGLAAGAAGPLKGGAGALAGGASSAAGLAGVPGFGANPTPGVYPFEQSPLPAGRDSTWGYGTPYGTMADITNPLSQFNAMRLAEAKEFDTQLRNAQAQAAMMAPWTEGRSKAELARQLYANQVRMNAQTQQSALLGGLQAARQMGVNAASQVGDALTRQYQYS